MNITSAITKLIHQWRWNMFQKITGTRYASIKHVIRKNTAIHNAIIWFIFFSICKLPQDCRKAILYLKSYIHDYTTRYVFLQKLYCSLYIILYTRENKKAPTGVGGMRAKKRYSTPSSSLRLVRTSQCINSYKANYDENCYECYKWPPAIA